MGKWGENISKKKKRIIFAIIITVLAVFLIFAFNESLTVRYYEIESDQITDSVRIAFIADLHSCSYGKDQNELLNRIDEQRPDLVLFGGDIVDDDLPYDNAVTVLKATAEKYPCYYVSGNHEYWSGKIDAIKQMIRGYGITVLEGQSKTVEVDGQFINISGVDDVETGESEFLQQIKNAAEQADSALFTIFMAHRPEYIDIYRQFDFDLILSGHAHGGQWRLPGIINGLLAPNQGFFPKYAGGLYKINDKTFIVSRGLAKESTRIPRIFNPPELVIVDLVPDVHLIRTGTLFSAQNYDSLAMYGNPMDWDDEKDLSIDGNGENRNDINFRISTDKYNGIDLKGSVKQNDGSWKSMNFWSSDLEGLFRNYLRQKEQVQRIKAKDFLTPELPGLFFLLKEGKSIVKGGCMLDDDSVQISVCDIDEDGVQEVLASVGNQIDENVTAVYEYSEIGNIPFTYCGCICCDTVVEYKGGNILWAYRGNLKDKLHDTYYYNGKSVRKI